MDKYRKAIRLLRENGYFLVEDTENDYIDVTKEAISRCFDYCNEKYFGGKLMKLPIKVSRAMDKMGVFVSEVKYSEHRFVPVCIKICSSYKITKKDMIDIMVHEMLHYYCDCYISDISDEDWDRALSIRKNIDYYGVRKGRTMINRLLHLDLQSSHGFIWGEKMREFNQKYPELNITVNETRKLLYSDNKLYKMQSNNACYMVEKPNGEHNIYFFNRNSMGYYDFRNTVSGLGKESPIPSSLGAWMKAKCRRLLCGMIYELYLDWEKVVGFSMSRKFPSSHYGEESYKWLVDNNAILTANKIDEIDENMDESVVIDDDDIDIDDEEIVDYAEIE